MYLKRLEVQGFKSFPNKISLEFNSGVTAIVGPNGSGKSNISDAVRWVLGEQSVKTLRGNRMEDVIFSGTEHRKPSGFAEVTIVLDNEGRKLPVDYSEVSVTRRLYRSGESEYYINRNQCRLKDVNELFYDTGIGKDGYSIIGQGRVDEVLNTKPDDRRSIFEEAAGVMKYKVKKNEAERKLEATQQNILRIKDIMAELELQLTTLEQQAVDARKYLNLRDELKALEVEAFVVSITKCSADIKKCDKDTLTQKDEYDRANEKRDGLGAEIRAKKERIEFLDEKLNALREGIFLIDSGLAATESEIKLNDEKVNGLLSGIRRIEDEISRHSERGGFLADELASNEKRAEYLKNELVRFNNELASVKARYEKILQGLDESDRSIEKMKLEASDLQENMYDRKNGLGKSKAELDNLNKNAAAIAGNIRQITLESDKDNIALDEKVDDAKEYRRSAEAIKQEIQGLSKEKGRLGFVIRDMEKEIMTKHAELGAKKSNLKLLIDMEERFEGFSDSVKNILRMCKSSPDFGEGIFGAVASLITVPREYETAIEMALGPAKQNVVTSDDQTAKKAVNYLKKSNGGRVTFLPLSSVKASETEATAIAEFARDGGFIGAARDLIDYDKKYHRAITHLLGRTVVVRDIDDAIRISKKREHSVRIVTLDGDIISQGGAVTGGSIEKRGFGILARRRQIPDLESEITELEKGLAGVDARLQAERKNFEATSESLRMKESELNKTALAQTKTESEITHLNDRIKSNGMRLEIYRKEKSEMAFAVEELGGVIEAEINKIEALADELETKRAEIIELTDQNKEEQAARDTLQADISSYSVSAASVNESLKSVEENIARVNNEIAGGERDLAKKQKETEKMKGEIEDLKQKNTALKKSIEGKEVERRGNLLQTESASAEKQAVSDEIQELSDEALHLNELEERIQREMQRISLRKERLDAELEGFQNRLWEEYELTYTNAMALRDAAIAAATADAAITRTGRAARINQLKEEIRELGFVNVQAIETLSETKARYTKMQKQQIDMEEACEKLYIVINEMMTVIRKNFSAQFEKINENFNTVFKELFRGGQARVMLSGSSDVLAAGIDIEVQFPGKKMQNMMLYSSGERAMTAIALIFAILKLNPAPFCLLDEIESTLDEANVYRLARYIKSYCNNTQFIMVTHRKGTMEGSDVMFGVTMEERGVSGIVSLKLGAQTA
ncbi:MAG: chromosome segregation protein SMC [Oscillospiraceae bacterium]|nr:chromosome segregation protein SMC [Oscillospiraceae bacterium]